MLWVAQHARDEDKIPARLRFSLPRLGRQQDSPVRTDRLAHCLVPAGTGFEGGDVDKTASSDGPEGRASGCIASSRGVQNSAARARPSGWRPGMDPVYGNELRIPYTSRDFPSGIVARSGDLRTEWGHLLWAALTVGRPNTAYVLAHGDASYHEALFRLSLVKMALEARPFSGSLHRTDAFARWTRRRRARSATFPEWRSASCSRVVSYTPHGFCISTYFAVSWILPSSAGVHDRTVGQDDEGAWHAFECKGRSSVPNAEDQRKAKTQAQRLVRVGSTACSLHVGAVSYLPTACAGVPLARP